MKENKSNGWRKFDIDISELQAYENLSNAIIEQAVADMADAVLKIELARRNEQKYEKVFLETDRFFRSDLIRNMTAVDPQFLKQIAATQGTYLIWTHGKGCSKCSFARAQKCKHGKGGVANWYAWGKGDHTCFRQLKEPYKPDPDSLPVLE